MELNTMTGLLIDFYRQAKLVAGEDVAAWCRAKGIDQSHLEREIAHWERLHGPTDRT